MYKFKIKQMTAVEWLEKQYNLGNGYERLLTESDFKQAKEMEKEDRFNSINKFLRECLIKNYYNKPLKQNKP